MTVSIAHTEFTTAVHSFLSFLASDHIAMSETLQFFLLKGIYSITSSRCWGHWPYLRETVVAVGDFCVHSEGSHSGRWEGTWATSHHDMPHTSAQLGVDRCCHNNITWAVALRGEAGWA